MMDYNILLIGYELLSPEHDLLLVLAVCKLIVSN